MTVIWTPQAKGDFRAVRDYLKGVAPSFAMPFANKILYSVNRIKSDPHYGNMIPERNKETEREVICYDYRMIYWISEGDQQIYILTIYDAEMPF